MLENVLVTGGGGFLGSAIVRLLLARGSAVRILARNRYPELESAGAQGVAGDIRDLESVVAACEGIDTVFHVAALAGVWGARQDFFAVNVTGTANVLEACRQQQVTRLVYTSSPSVVFADKDIKNGDETLPYPDKYLAPYPETKAIAENEVLNAAAAEGGNGLLTCALRPHLIWGPGDTHIIPRLMAAARTGRLRQIGDGTNKVDITYVDNAAQAHLQAAAALRPGSPVNGSAYFIGDAEPVCLWPWINELLQRLGLPVVKKAVSYEKARCLGAVMEFIYKIMPLRGEPTMTRFVAAQFAKSHYFSHARAEQDFGYKPKIDNETGLQRVVEWMSEKTEAK